MNKFHNHHDDSKTFPSVMIAFLCLLLLLVGHPPADALSQLQRDQGTNRKTEETEAKARVDQGPAEVCRQLRPVHPVWLIRQLEYAGELILYNFIPPPVCRGDKVLHSWIPVRVLAASSAAPRQDPSTMKIIGYNPQNVVVGGGGTGVVVVLSCCRCCC